MTPVPIATTPMLGAAYCAQPTWEAGWVLLPKLVSEYSDIAESQWSILATNIGAEVPSGLVSTSHTFNRTINRTIVILHPNIPRRGWMHLTPIGLGPQLRFMVFWHIPGWSTWSAPARSWISSWTKSSSNGSTPSSILFSQRLIKAAAIEQAGKSPNSMEVSSWENHL